MNCIEDHILAGWRYDGVSTYCWKSFFIMETYSKDKFGNSLRLEGMEPEMLLFLKTLQVM